MGDGDGEPVGWLTHLDILRAYNTRLQHGIEQAQQHPSRTHRGAGPVGGALARLRGYRVVDLDLATASPPVGRRVTEIPWPARTTVLAVRRGDRILDPGDAGPLERGDRLTVLVPASASDGLVDAITETSDPQA